MANKGQGENTMKSFKMFLILIMAVMAIGFTGSAALAQATLNLSVPDGSGNVTLTFTPNGTALNDVLAQPQSGKTWTNVDGGLGVLWMMPSISPYGVYETKTGAISGSGTYTANMTGVGQNYAGANVSFTLSASLAGSLKLVPYVVISGTKYYLNTTKVIGNYNGAPMTKTMDGDSWDFALTGTAPPATGTPQVTFTKSSSGSVTAYINLNGSTQVTLFGTAGTPTYVYFLHYYSDGTTAKENQSFTGWPQTMGVNGFKNDTISGMFGITVGGVDYPMIATAADFSYNGKLTLVNGKLSFSVNGVTPPPPNTTKGKITATVSNGQVTLTLDPNGASYSNLFSSNGGFPTAGTNPTSIRVTNFLLTNPVNGNWAPTYDTSVVGLNGTVSFPSPSEATARFNLQATINGTNYWFNVDWWTMSFNGSTVTPTGGAWEVATGYITPPPPPLTTGTAKTAPGAWLWKINADGNFVAMIDASDKGRFKTRNQVGYKAFNALVFLVEGPDGNTFDQQIVRAFSAQPFWYTFRPVSVKLKLTDNAVVRIFVTKIDNNGVEKQGWRTELDLDTYINGVKGKKANLASMSIMIAPPVIGMNGVMLKNGKLFTYATIGQPLVIDLGIAGNADVHAAIVYTDSSIHPLDVSNGKVMYDRVSNSDYYGYVVIMAENSLGKDAVVIRLLRPPCK